jgi:hypothetical protein
MLLGVIACVRCVLAACELAFYAHLTHAITPSSFCAGPPEDGRVTPETYRGIESQ